VGGKKLKSDTKTWGKKLAPTPHKNIKNIAPTPHTNIKKISAHTSYTKTLNKKLASCKNMKKN
jgi:hypothetical protein